MSDNITLPREVVEEALEALELEATSPPLETTAAAMAALRTALAAEQPVPTDKDSLTVQSRLDAESFREERDEARALLNGVLQDIEALRRDAEQPKHPGYIIGNHWFETAYERLCAGEAEDAILEDYELVREPRLRDLRRDAERYRWLRDKAPPDIGDMASVRDSHDPSEIDAAIDAAMEASTAPASAAADSSTAPEAKP